MSGVGSHSSVNSGEFATTDAQRAEILRQYRRVAIVGLSSNPYRPSHFVAVYLAQHGFEITPVNPRETRILARPSYPSLKQVPQPLEIVDIFRDPAAIPPIVEEAIECGAKVIWMQLGLIHETAARRARDAGLIVVMDRCIKIEHARFGGGLNLLGLNGGLLSSARARHKVKLICMPHSPGFLKIVDDAKSRIQQIDIEGYRSMVAAGRKHLLIDVREDREFAAGHAKGAMHLGKGIIERDIEKVVPAKDATMVLYCGGGFRSALAADSLQNMGYTRVISLDGGWHAYELSGLPIEK